MDYIKNGKYGTYKVYKITNLIDGKIYIGQTKKAIHLRWSHHKSTKYSSCGYITRAIRKHGPENFKIEWIATALAEEHIDWLEDHLIREYNSLVPIGYNLKYGGSHPTYTEEGKKLKSQEQIKRYSKTTPEQRKEMAKHLLPYINDKKRPITAINPVTTEVQNFNTVNDAVSTGFSTSQIYKSLDPEKLGTSKNFHFFYTDEFSVEEMFLLAEKQNLDIKLSHLEGRKKAVANMQDHINSQKKPVIAIHTKTFEYQVFESIADARRLGFSATGINNGLKGMKRSTKKHYFQYLSKTIPEHIEITKTLFK